MQTNDESKLNQNKLTHKKERIQGTFLTIAGGILWGISGVCGQFLFQNKEVTASWLVPIRLVIAGLLLLLYYVIRDRGKDDRFCKIQSFFLCGTGGLYGINCSLDEGQLHYTGFDGNSVCNCHEHNPGNSYKEKNKSVRILQRHCILHIMSKNVL